MKPAIEGGEPVRTEFLVFGAPMIEEPEIAEVVSTLRSGWIGTGPKVQRFEKMFQHYCGARHALALNSCTAALHLSMIAAGVKEGDEVIVPDMTFCATANAVLHTGAKPVFVDVDRETMNITPEAIEQALSSRTKAVIPVHMAGRPCAMDAILPLAQEHGLLVIEDAAHAIEAACQGEKIGALSDASCFSFYVTKNLVTGEGGMVTTARDDWAEKIQVMGLHGLSRGAWKRYSDEGFRHYRAIAPGFKANMTDMQASLGIHQLPRLPQYLKRREAAWQRYDKAFASLPVILPAPVRDGDVHARHLYTLLLDLEALRVDRDTVMQALHEENIGSGIHFLGLHQHPYYRDIMDISPDAFPNAAWIAERTLSLPFSARLVGQDVDDVICAVSKVLEFYRR